MKQATINDYARMCKFYGDCKKCPIGICNNSTGITCNYLIRLTPDKANEIILKWCEEHPVVMRQSELLKIFPSAALYNGVISMCPMDFDGKFREDGLCCNYDSCTECKKPIGLRK